MLALPNKGISRSVKKHNVELDVLCDWIEASVVFDEESLSKADIIDILIEEQVYDEHDFAAEIVDDAWSVVSRRIKYLSFPLGLNITHNSIRRHDEWTQFPEYGFCLALSCVELYSDLGATNYINQGALFENLTVEALSNTLKGWNVKRIGWESSQSSQPKLLKDILESVIDDLKEKEGTESNTHLNSKVKDLGLDLYAFYSFQDERASFPVLLIQCASGENWKTKRQTPDIELFKKIISFNSQPVRGFAIPFAFADPVRFRKETASINGVVVDRYRLLKAFIEKKDNSSQTFNNELVTWVSTRIEQFPRDNE